MFEDKLTMSLGGLKASVLEAPATKNVWLGLSTDGGPQRLMVSVGNFFGGKPF